MTLEEFIQQGLTESNPECPQCGSEGEHIRGIEYRCNTDRQKCDTLYWIKHNKEFVDDSMY